MQLSDVHAQKETTWWYFGYGAGLNFSNVQPIADTNAFFADTDGAASISDSNGNLLFYFGADTLWNADHNVMLNGTGLSSEDGIEGGTIIVPNPGDINQYYVFTVDGGGTFNTSPLGVFYHLVDMTLDSGLGAIVAGQKNVQLRYNVEYKITATQHANGEDYWLAVREQGTGKNLLYLITATGINTSPVETTLGNVSSNSSECQGTLRFNHQGTMMAHSFIPDLEIYDFDNATGVLSNLRFIDDTLMGSSAGLEFSPDDSKLYLDGPFQYDLSVPTAAAIEASEFFCGETLIRMGGMQLGLDGKIYGNHVDLVNGSAYADCIHNPNALGAACGYQDSAIFYQGRKGVVSVPQFITSFFKTTFYADSACAGDTTWFDINYTFIDSVLWNFGDPASGTADTSTAVAPFHIYSNPGSYTVTLIAQNGVLTDTVVKTITVGQAPSITLGTDYDVCLPFGPPLALTPGNEKGIYQWHDGSADSVFTATGPGSYAVTFTNTCGTDSAALNIYAATPLSVELGEDITSCSTTALLVSTIDSLTPVTQLQWVVNGDTQTTTNGTLPLTKTEDNEQFTIRLTATNACGSASDTVRLTFLPQPDGVLPPDSIYCLDEAFYLLNQQTPNVSYQWSDGSTGPQFKIENSGTYFLVSSNLCGTLIDTFRIVFNGQPIAYLGPDTAVCFSDSGYVLTPRKATAGQRYMWSDFSTDSAIVITDTGLYSVTVTLNDCRSTDSIRIGARGDCYDGCLPILSNIFSPNSDGVNDLYTPLLECDLSNYKLSIFNRWGGLVFFSDRMNQPWDGTANGQAVSDGTYFVVLEYDVAGGESRRFQASVTIVR